MNSFGIFVEKKMKTENKKKMKTDKK